MKTRAMMVGAVPLGGGARVSVQSMTNTDTRDAAGTLLQIRALAREGCDIVRVSVYDDACVAAVRELVDKSPVPLVADIHFDYRLALAAMEHGADKIRINPGNIGGTENLRKVVDMARERQIPIRVGVNAGSLEKELLEREGCTPDALCESALKNVAAIEAMDYDNIVVSIKASNVSLCVRAYERFAQCCRYPLHIGITETGTLRDGSLKSAMGLGILLDEGLGDTMRVSLTGAPEEEVLTAQKILQFIGLRRFGVEIVSCPTCARTEIDLIALAEQAEKALAGIHKPMRVAIMGCAVNGPGEAREADFGIAGGKGDGILFRKGEIIRKVPEDQLLAVLVEEAKAYAGE